MTVLLTLYRSWSAPVFTGQRQTPHDVAGRAPCWPVTASAAWAAGINPADMPTPAITASARMILVRIVPPVVTWLSLRHHPRERWDGGTSHRGHHSHARVA